MADGTSCVDAIPFQVRFFVDEYFIEEILKDKAKAIKILLKLSHIHKKSKFYPMLHNEMFDDSFRTAIKDKLVRGDGLLGAIHPIQYPDFIKNEPDFASKVIKYAINLANARPWKVYILTSTEKSKEYLNNHHYQNNGVKSSVKISYGLDAESSIEVIHSQKD